MRDSLRDNQKLRLKCNTLTNDKIINKLLKIIKMKTNNRSVDEKEPEHKQLYNSKHFDKHINTKQNVKPTPNTTTTG